MDIEDQPYDTRTGAEALGQAGLFRGENAQICVGQSLVIGRSRTCGLSVARSAACLRLGKDALEQHSSYRKISRQHIKVSLLSPNHLEIEDLSTNGTVVDGFRIDRRMITDFRSRIEGVVVEFGDGEVVEFRPTDGRAAAGSVSSVSHSISSV
ncbi:MAG: FHA domain-containing protein [Planctomycetota bacterium]